MTFLIPDEVLRKFLIIGFHKNIVLTPPNDMSSMEDSLLDMAVKMLPHVVANAFVKQYYAILNKCPENVHKFYQESSLLGWPGPDGVLTPVTTLSGINDKIMSSDYKYCSAEINTTDAQASLEGGVIVAVTGSLTRKDNVKKNFSQTFFLAKQEKGFFVLNDILRFSDVFVSTANAPADYDGIHDQSAKSIRSSVHSDISDSPTSICTKAVENRPVKKSFDPPVSKETFAKVAASTSSVASAEKVRSVVAPASNEKPSVIAPASEKKVPSVIVPALSEKVPSVVVPASNSTPKITYASMVAKEIPATSPRTARVASSVTKQVASPTTKASVPLVDRAPKASTPSSAGPKALAPSNKVSPNPASPGNGAPNNSAYSEARGIYIGRLPYDITKQGIVDVLKKFGPVRRNADTIQIRRHEDGFCCGFVEFESADSARRAVEAHHVNFGDREAYITYKRSYSNRGNDGGSSGRSPTRAGSRNSSFRGWDNQASHNGRSQSENRADHNKGQSRGPQQSRRPFDQWSRDASRDR
ncbi:Nuclear transport factor 2 [Sesamum alatum]|uniref:Nuclear transport factor 2 n=1 Tax=Sesamum alatum TaxID=300844 RepID=A0AAE2CPT4_9LAMI|nr:Nuclear transport factor 2 [Sesamum alatum]